MVSEMKLFLSSETRCILAKHSHRRGGILLYWLPTRLMICPRMIKLAATINVGASDVVIILRIN
jgi:hypothetical protein